MTVETHCFGWDSCLSAGRLQSLPAEGGPAYRQAGLPADRRVKNPLTFKNKKLLGFLKNSSSFLFNFFFYLIFLSYYNHF
ncbi:MAG TPA: hypothetical protein P5237_01250 [Candidatus Paceibacterota bacterium]|nr:hypothetical protein [Candidatus Paceibacterota bacterium]